MTPKVLPRRKKKVLPIRAPRPGRAVAKKKVALLCKPRRVPPPQWAKRFYVFLALDYSQVEIRMLAEASGDEVLLAQFEAGMDIHCLVGEALTKIPAERIANDKETRTFIKNFHFGMVYGLDGPGLYYYCKAKGVNTTEKKCIKYRKIYFDTYKKVGKFIVDTQAFAREHGYVDSIFGFRRKLGGDWEEDRTTNPENQAVNSPIQGAAHNLLLIVLGLLKRFPKRYNLLQKCIAEIHDALIFRVRLDHLQDALEQAKGLMEVDVKRFVYKEYGRKMRVPLKADAKAGFRYGTMVDYKGESIPEFVASWAKYNTKKESEISEKYKVKQAA